MKLIRDFVPRIIEESGRRAVYHIVRDRAEHLSRLRDKVVEELQEFTEEPCLEEAADLYEVLLTLVELHDMDMNDVVATAQDKRKRCGGFRGGAVLVEVTDE